jgi:hypothetical protein
MRATGLLSSLLTFLWLFSTVSASWRWSPLDTHAMIRRQDNNQNNNNDESTTASPRSTPSNSASASRTASNDDENASASATASETDSNSSEETESASRTGSASGNSTRTTSKPKSTNVDPRLPAGGIELLTPAATEGAQYYKVGDWITFEWNYTSLSNTPAAVDVYATCMLNQATYTIASNMSVEETGKVLWQPNPSEETAGFPIATYTLVIHDAAKDPTQVASAGDLGTFNQFRFGMYTPQPYTPLNEFKCSTCSAGISLLEQQALSVMGITGLVSVVSFMWFINGVGLLG